MRATLDPHKKGMPLMKCGHSANAIDEDGNPMCVICWMPDTTDWKEVIDTPDLSTRTARCAYYGRKISLNNECDMCMESPDGLCHCEQPSNTDLAFFEYEPEEEYDKYYCGCHSWD